MVTIGQDIISYTRDRALIFLSSCSFHLEFRVREFGSDIPAGDGNIEKLFLRCEGGGGNFQVGALRPKARELAQHGVGE